jgi:hypothetical protein
MIALQYHHKAAESRFGQALDQKHDHEHQEP